MVVGGVRFQSWVSFVPIGLDGEAGKVAFGLHSRLRVTQLLLLPSSLASSPV